MLSGCRWVPRSLRGGISDSFCKTKEHSSYSLWCFPVVCVSESWVVLVMTCCTSGGRNSTSGGLSGGASFLPVDAFMILRKTATTQLNPGAEKKHNVTSRQKAGKTILGKMETTKPSLSFLVNGSGGIFKVSHANWFRCSFLFQSFNDLCQNRYHTCIYFHMDFAAAFIQRWLILHEIFTYQFMRSLGEKQWRLRYYVMKGTSVKQITDSETHERGPVCGCLCFDSD